MPAPKTKAVTLAQIESGIAAMGHLPEYERKAMRSAVRRFAEISGRSLDDIIADPATIRSLADKAPWMLAGLKKGSWANILSRLRKAMELCGVRVHRSRRNFKLAGDWEALLDPLSRGDRDELRRFAGWCSTIGIATGDVSDEVFGQFYRYLDEQMTQRNPRERGHVARRAWNRAIALPDTIYPQIACPAYLGERHIRWADCPASLQVEVLKYAESVVKSDFLDDTRRPIKPVTRDNYLDRLRLLMTDLVKAGEPLEGFTSLAKVVNPETVKRAILFRQRGAEPDEKARHRLHGLVTAALSAAQFIEMDEAALSGLRILSGKVRPRDVGMSEKTRQRLQPLLNMSVRMRLLNLPERTMREAMKVKTEPTIRIAQQVQMALLLDLLIHVPMRIRNASELDLGSTIVAPLGGKVGRWRISLASKNVKNGVGLDMQLGDSLGALLDRYVKTYRSMFPVDGTPALFVGQCGARKGPSALSKQLKKFVHRETGITLHPHLMRALAAISYLEAHPGDFETVRRLLGHKKIDTTVRFYEGFLMTANSFARYDAVVERLREDGWADRGEGRIDDLRLKDRL